MGDEETRKLRRLIETGIVTSDQVDECRRAKKEITAFGDPALTITDILMLRGFLKANPDGEEEEEEQVPKVGQYLIEGKIGQGGMGIVYRARKVGAEEAVVALKVLPNALAENPEYVKRFEREAATALRISHPNLVRGLAVGQSDGRLFYVMEYVEGSRLNDRVDHRGPRDEAEAATIAAQICGALEAIRQAGLIHRDVHPGNIILTPSGAAKLMDLGLVRPVGSQVVALTRAGILLGTPHFMSPEQVAGSAKLDIRTDVFSLGATLYFMLTGVRPFHSEDRMEVIRRHLRHDLDDPRRFRPELTRAMEAVLRRAMAFKAGERFASPLEMQEALNRLHAA